MSKFCKACNKQVDDSLSFCPTCGGQLETVADSQPVVSNNDAKAKVNDVAGKAKNVAGDLVSRVKSDKLVLVLVAIIAVIALFAVGSFVLKVLQPGYGTANSYLKNYYVKQKADKVVKYVHEDTYEDEDDFVENIEDYVYENWEDSDIEYKSVKIVDSFTYSKDLVEEFAEELQDSYDIDEDDVKSVKDFFVKYVVEYDGEKVVSYGSITAYKVGSKWYIDR